MAASSKKLLLTCQASSLRPHAQLAPLYPLCTHHRHIFENFRRRLAQSRDLATPPPIKKPKPDDEDDEAQKPQIGSGGLAPGSSILDEVDTPRKEKEAANQQVRRSPLKTREPVKYVDPTTIKRTQKDPNPIKRVQWLQKMATRLVRHRGRLSKGEKILRTERFDVSKSPFIKTSVKKLGPLARQIAGKPLEEAMVQMRFSKKLAARDVLKHLEYARNKAIVEKQMGIGLAIPTPEGVPKKEEQMGEGKALVIEDKQGKRRKIDDPSSMYVEQAWVGRGRYQFGTDYRARGRAHRLHLPYTSITVSLKEERTRIREAEERALKRLKKKVWVPLPDRPVTAQRQYPLW